MRSINRTGPLDVKLIRYITYLPFCFVRTVCSAVSCDGCDGGDGGGGVSAAFSHPRSHALNKNLTTHSARTFSSSEIFHGYVNVTESRGPVQQYLCIWICPRTAKRDNGIKYLCQRSVSKNKQNPTVPVRTLNVDETLNEQRESHGVY